MSGRLAWLVLACGCGRIGFGAHVQAGDGGNADAVILTDALGALQIAYVKASNTDMYDQFGYAVALSGDAQTFAAGAIDESSNATGIDGNQSDNSDAHSGAAYVFARAATTWAQQAYVKASNPDPGDEFGTSIALSSDGSTLVVGAPFEASAATGVDGNQADNSAANAGAAYVFTRTGTTWSQQAYVKASNTDAGDELGVSVALSGDGNTLAIGATGEAGGSAGINGDQADNSAPSAGAVYVLVRSGATWTQTAYVKASNPDADDQFGTSVALSSDGTTLAVGAIGEASSATGIDGNQSDNSTPQAGAVYVFALAAQTWSQQAYVKGAKTTAGDFLGASVSLSPDGNTLAAGVPGEDTTAANSGAVYVYARSGVTWAPQAFIKATNPGVGDQFGTAVSLATDALLAGAPYEDSDASGIDGNENDNSLTDSGAAYVYQRSGTTWTPAAYLKASNPGSGDNYGQVVSAADLGFACGAFRESSSTTGIDSTPDDSAMNAGAAYIMFY